LNLSYEKCLFTKFDLQNYKKALKGKTAIKLKI
jgi:hypothetical protein